MSGHVRDLEAHPIGELTDLSVSRIKVVDQCGLKFKYSYIDRIPSPTEGAGALFGNVIHDALQVWYGEPESTTHQEIDLKDCVREQWRKQLPSEIVTALQRCLVTEEALEHVAAAILIGRPTLKAPKMTKDYLESEEMAFFEDQREILLKRCDALEDIRWPKDENPIQAWHKSLTIAEQLSARWKHQPRPIAVEHPFRVEFDGYTLKGRIDQIRRDVFPGGETFIDLLDVKTGRQLFTQMDAFIQAFVYDEACYQDPELPSPDWVTFFMARHNMPQRGKIDRERHRALATRVLNGVARKIITADWQPNYGPHCRMCDYRGLCEKEISLWPPGLDSMVLEAA